MSYLAPDVQQVEKFLTTLDSRTHHRWCWQVQKEGWAKHFHMSLRDALPALTTWNNNGCAIFVTINETDGQGRKTENIKRVRALFVDLDGADVQGALACAVVPHMVVQTSPGKYHAYWLVTDVPLNEFRPLQRALAARFDGDKSVCDLGRVMRVPGFYHHKTDPYLSHLYHPWAVWLGAPWTCEEIKTQFKQWYEKPRKYVARAAPAHLPLEVTRVLPMLDRMNLYVRDKGNGVHTITCPWHHLHEHGSDIAEYFEPSENNGWHGGFHCFHAHCADRGVRQIHRLIELWLEQRP
jgi:RepB DNA-primase N-terminal domain